MDLAYSTPIESFVVLGNGDGTFQARRRLLEDGASSMATADFDVDGNPDIVVMNFGNSHVTTFLGNGDGSFYLANSVVVGRGPAAVAVADFNVDGRPDMVVVNQQDSTFTIYKSVAP